MFWTIAIALVKAIITGEIKHWWLAYQAHLAIREKINDKNIQNDAFNQPSGAADTWLHSHGSSPKD